MSLSAGRKLAHYEILEKIGSGGMGDVYLARDSKLNRDVALKILPATLAESEDRRVRFEREAQALAALNHPNIVHVYSVENADGVHFITMELVKGSTLKGLIPKGGMPLAKFFEIAIPLADAVAAAHQEGITHRDLKPDNVMVPSKGSLKILDFGLARQDPPIHLDGSSESPTAMKTQEGVLVGTLHYMSPEQAEGKTVDHRSDIFSLGTIFYEMLTGNRPFDGETPAAVLSSIIKDDFAPLAQSRPTTPRTLARLVGRCLAKDRERRIQTCKDVRNELEDSQTGSADCDAPPVRSTTRFWAAVVAGFVLLSTVIAVSMQRLSATAPLRFTNLVQITSDVGVEGYPSWSPDGRTLVYQANQAGNWDIWVKQVGGGPAVNRTADHAGEDMYPNWSPDGNWLAFWSEREGGGYFLMSPLGGAPRKLLDASALPGLLYGSAPQWSADSGSLICLVSEGLELFAEIVDLSTRESQREALEGRFGGAFDISWSPDGRALAYVDSNYALGADVSMLWVKPFAGGDAIPITEGHSYDWSPSWSLDSRTLFFASDRGGNMDLWEQPLGRNLRPTGAARPATVGLGIWHGLSLASDRSQLAYSRGRLVANAYRIPILRDRLPTWDDAQQLTFDEAYVEHVNVSPDGRHVAVSSDRSGNLDLWLLPLDGGEMVQLTTEPTADWDPQWSPDGTEIAFHSFRSGNRDIWVMPVSGGPVRQITNHEGQDLVARWSPDGREIVFSSNRDAGTEVWSVATSGGTPGKIAALPDIAFVSSWSPEGKSLFVNTMSNYRLWRVPR